MLRPNCHLDLVQENELVENVTTGDHEFEEIVEEYKEEILVQEEVLELPLIDSAHTAPTQSKPRCINLIFYNYYLYMLCAFTLQKFYENHMHRYICPMSLTSACSSRCYA